jgi:tRNA (mo5U34)-methyltransferase
MNQAGIIARLQELGEWFHNMDLGGVQTAPNHALGDYPNCKWRHFAHAIPASLAGKSVLDVGCNGGFYALEMKRRGAARVLGIDEDEGYLAQARFAAEVSGLAVEFRRMSVYDVASLGERFDLVIFMGVLYHLRHPLLALDLLAEHVVGDQLLFQSMLRGSLQLGPSEQGRGSHEDPVSANNPASAKNGASKKDGASEKASSFEEDYAFEEAQQFEQASWPKLHFIEHRYAHDPTNWWIPNKACAEAMLRSAGFVILSNPEEEVYLCRREWPAGANRHPDAHGSAGNGRHCGGARR